MQSSLKPGHVEVRLYGKFDILLADGRSLRPASSKARGLIALVASGNRMERSRLWLRNMLWSDRGEEQRAASLRQCLSEIRKTFQDFPEIVLVDRETVRLDPGRVAVNRVEMLEGAQFLEDLSIRDPAFLNWLASERSRSVSVAAPTPPEEPQIEVVLIRESRHDPKAVDLELQFEDTFSKCLKDFGCANLKIGKSDCSTVKTARVVLVRAVVPSAKNAILRVAIDDVGTGRRIWSDRKAFAFSSDQSGQAMFLSLCFQAADCAADLGPWNKVTTAAELVSLGLKKLFTINRKNVEMAVSLLRRAIEIDPRDIYFAWLAQAYTIQYVERYVVHNQAFRELVDSCCRSAMSGGQTNSHILAAVANARTNIHKNFDAGLALGTKSVQANPANPLAWWAFSNALVCVGKSKDAYLAAMNAKELAGNTRFAAWTDLQLSVTAALLGKRDVATRAGESSAALLPDFRPPLRYLCALYAIDHKEHDFLRCAELLTAREQDFSIRRMVEDDAYPIGIMRRYGTSLTEALRNYE